MKSQDSVLKSKYNDYSDEELIDMYREGDVGVSDYLLSKYKNLVRAKARSMYILGGDADDCMQEGMIGLFKAVRDYDPGRDSSFMTFADLCVSRQMYTAVTASGRQKHMPLNSYVSIYTQVVNSDGEETGASLEDSIAGSKNMNPEAMMIDKENVAHIERFIDSELSNFEKQAMDLFLTGMGYVQIAKVLGKDEKATDNALNRAKSKLKKYLEKENQI